MSHNKRNRWWMLAGLTALTTTVLVVAPTGWVSAGIGENHSAGLWSVEVPSNDDWPQAESITGEGAFAFDNTGATTDGPPHELCATDDDGQETTHDVWYCWTATCDGTVTIDTCESTTVDTKMFVYDGCDAAPTDANMIECSEDACVYQSRLSFEAVEGQQYLIRIGVHPSLGGGSGAFNLACGVEVEPPCAHENEQCLRRDGWGGYRSGRGELLVADDFIPDADGSITGLCWWGTYFDGEGRCLPESTDAFKVAYYEDAGGVPGARIAGPFRQDDGSLTVAGPVRTGGMILDELFEYEYAAVHEPVSVSADECYWVEISNSGSAACAWYWEASAPGDRLAWQVRPYSDPPAYDEGEVLPDDLAFCFDFTEADSAVCIAPPANDDCAAAVPVYEGATWFDTTGATTDGPEEPECQFALDDPVIGQDVWFWYHAADSGTAALTLCDSLYDTKMAVYESQACPPTGEPCACNDDGCPGDWYLGSRFVFPVENGGSYLLRIGGYGEAMGQGTMVLTLNDPDCNANGLPDSWDIMDNTSADEDANGVPDECEVAVLYVDAEARGLEYGTSWEHAYRDLTPALEVAGAPDTVAAEIRVAGGTYRPSSFGFDHQEATFQMATGLALLGGFAGSANPEDPNERDVALYETILSGDLDGDGTPMVSDCCRAHEGTGCDYSECEAAVCNYRPECCEVEWDGDCAEYAAEYCGTTCNDEDCENSYHVVTAIECDATAVLDGFTVAHGYANGSSPDSYGGGIYIERGAPTVTNCMLIFNGAAGYGAGMFIAEGSPVITGCLASGNVAWEAGGGAIACQHSAAVFSNCIVTHNAGGDGGGFHCSGGSPTIRNCEITDNTADHHGGGFALYASGAVITNCTISRNIAHDGGALYCLAGPPVVTNCILWGNVPDELDFLGDPQITATYTDIAGGWAGEGNIDADPLFVDPEVGDFHLSADSPCINHGNNDAPGLPEEDFEGQARVQHCRVDMGADESPYFFDCNENGAADACDIAEGISTDINGNGVPDECECLDNPVFVPSPPDGVVDARRPHPPDSTTPCFGFGMPGDSATPIVIDLGLVAGAGDLSCWSLCETPDMSQSACGSNSITAVIDNGDGTYTLELHHGIQAGAVTTIQFNGGDYVEYTHHPGNVDGSPVANANDIVELLECLEDPGECEVWETDIDVSGTSDAEDIIDLIDLLNGDGSYEPWVRTPLPTNDGSCP